MLLLNYMVNTKILHKINLILLLKSIVYFMELHFICLLSMIILFISSQLNQTLELLAPWDKSLLELSYYNKLLSHILRTLTP